MDQYQEYRGILTDYKRNQAQPAEEGRRTSGFYPILKRTIDLVLSSAALVVLSPGMLLVMAVIRADSPGRPIYVQKRVGKDGRIFNMYKFRSMCVNADAKLNELKEQNEMDGPVFKMAHDPRVTRVGHFIRKYSIDELPQLINIIKGDMSIVGPRPPIPDEVSQYNAHQAERLTVVPGLTCYWQISGRSDVSFEEWVELDLKYIRERSLLTDIRIIFKTFKAVLTGQGAY